MTLKTGDALPEISATNLDGDAVTLPAAAAGNWTAVLFYRGHW